MPTTNYKPIIERIKEMYGQGISKADIYQQVSPTVDKPVFIARLIASLPNPVSEARYRLSNRVLAIIFFIIAFLMGVAKFGQVLPYNVYAAIVLGLLFFSLFASGAWGIWKRSYNAYLMMIALMIIMIPQTLRVTLHEFAIDLDSMTDDDKLLAGLDLFVEIPLLFFLLWFLVRMRNNIFSKTGFFGKPKKDQAGNYQFESAWELKAIKKAKELAQSAKG